MPAFLIALAVVGLAAPAEAQNAAQQGKWTVELNVGGSAGSGSTSGTPTGSFPAGAPFTLASGQPSRFVPSWFFGDGTVLINQVLAQFAANAGTSFPSMAPVDAALRASGGRLGSGGLLGVRLGRTLTPRLAAELSIERSLAKMGLRESLLDGLESGGDSFKGAFEALLSTLPVANLSVTSLVTVRDDRNAQLRLAGALKWTVWSGTRLEGYVTGGGGLIRNSGDGARAILTGQYRFSLFGAFPVDQTDRVVVAVNQPKNQAMGHVGGGVTFALSSTSGLRADVRLTLSAIKDVTALSASPDTDALSPPIVLSTSPGISPGVQFSTQAEVRSTLSGAIENFRLFTGSGLSKRISFTVGIFKRF
jgi:hypothetical protein